MSQRLPSIDALLAFEASARSSSFEAAAEALHVSASAVAKRIAGLEDLLGVSLFTRAGKGLQLTPAGHDYLPQVREALSSLRAIPLHQRAHQGLERLRVSSTPTFARQVLVPALPAFTAAHPGVELELTLSVPLLAEGDAAADVEIRHGPVPESISLEQVLLRDRLTPLAAPALLAGRSLATPADLRGLPLLRTPLQPWAPWWQAAGVTAPEPTTGPRFVDLGLVLAAALAGQGVALMRLSLAQQELREGRLVQPFALTVEAERHYGLVVHRPSPAAEAFRTWLHAHCAALAAELSSRQA